MRATASDVAGRRGVRGRRARVGAGLLGCRGNRRSAGDRGDDGQSHRPRRGPSRPARARRLGCRADGRFGAPPLPVVVGGEVHVSLTKALGLLGFGRARVTRVAVDGQGRMRADALPPLDGRTIVCLQAGNVNTGAFDPAEPDLRPRARGRRVGPRRRRVRPVGRGLTPVSPFHRRLRRRRLVGHRCAQVAQRRLRLRHRLRARCAAAARRDVSSRPPPRRTWWPVNCGSRRTPDARDVAPRARLRALGGAACARTAGEWPISSIAPARMPAASLRRPAPPTASPSSMTS